MHRQDFHFDLPEELIARFPLAERSDSRLLKLARRSGELADHGFKDLPKLLKPEDVLVFNDTKVIPARLFAKKDTGGNVEILIERIRGSNQALCLLRASRSPKPGALLTLADGSSAEVKGRQGQFFDLVFDDSKDLLDRLEAVGHMPLPPYMQRADERADRSRYQTVYAEKAGAVAAPTAGLHFTNNLLSELHEIGIQQAMVTLHVGSGTFQPVKVDRIEEHKMHSERYELSEQSAATIRAAKERGGRIIAVGTTSVRVLESCVRDGQLAAGTGETNIFIYPGKRFSIIDGLITNFHLPESTLIMLVSAFAGIDATLAAYRHAVDERYRFFSYGDAMLIV